MSATITATTTMSYPPGTAPIKAEYLLPIEKQAITRAAFDDDAAEGTTGKQRTTHTDSCDGDAQQAEEEGNAGSVGPVRTKRSQAEKKAKRGANTGRRWVKMRDEIDLCWKFANGEICEFGDKCRQSHDIAAYFAAKPRDIHYDPDAPLSVSPPYVQEAKMDGVFDDEAYPSLDFSTTCPEFAATGECKFGIRCRFLGAHVNKGPQGELLVKTDEEKKARTVATEHELNSVGADTLKSLRTNKFPLPITKEFLKELQGRNPEEPIQVPAPKRSVEGKITQRTGETPSSAVDDIPDVPMRFMEKRRLNWTGKTYLAPLTTAGNLPFRRICVDYGCDITCGEMGLATSFLQGSKEEWSLVRRHPSERIFGMQLAGSKPSTMVPAAEAIGKLAPDMDFVDVNCGCPIDLVFRQGSGSALLDSAGKLGKMLAGMNKALGEIPLTAKLRTGIKDGKNTAHKLMPRLSAEFGVSCITLHGRTRQQRYTKLADWDYIKTCVEQVRAREEEEDLVPVPIFGGGDCFSYADYRRDIDSTGVDGVMIGRGALIKPWIFTEIREQREWDISSRERLDKIRQLAEYGVNHFGSDTAGVNTARRYVCEALSFQYRYIPLGLLERLPGRINDRPPAFRGRDELETLLASDNSQDWVKITEMFLGPAPERWSFTPKHKSNSYGGEEGQG